MLTSFVITASSCIKPNYLIPFLWHRTRDFKQVVECEAHKLRRESNSEGELKELQNMALVSNRFSEPYSYSIDITKASAPQRIKRRNQRWTLIPAQTLLYTDVCSSIEPSFGDFLLLNAIH